MLKKKCIQAVGSLITAIVVMVNVGTNYTVLASDKNHAAITLTNSTSSKEKGLIKVNAGDSKQLIVVYTEGYETCKAWLEIYQKRKDNTWELIVATKANVGKNGFAQIGKKYEGDGKSPQGKYNIGNVMYGKYANPGVKYKYKQVDSKDYWVDDSNSKYYNEYMRGPANGRWKSAESLYRSDDLYSYLAVINYNTLERMPGKGSAIFFHQWRGYGFGTAGCISTDQGTLLRILKWLDPAKKPVIIMGISSNLSSF